MVFQLDIGCTFAYSFSVLNAMWHEMREDTLKLKGTLEDAHDMKENSKLR